MRASDDERAFAADEKFPEQLRQRAVTQPVVEHELGLGIAARNGVADDDEVGIVRQVALVVTVHHGDFFGGEERRHWLINILIRAGDGKTLVVHRGGGGRHRGAADAGEMD